MTVLVTGGAGYIGSHMVHALLDAGERVVVLDNLATGFDWAVAQGALLVIGDAGNPQLVATLIAKVSDLVRAHSDALTYLRGGGESVTLNCGYALVSR
jgi:UDP-glucose 4-epimerase